MSYSGVTVPKTWVISNNYPLFILKKHNINLNNYEEVINFFENYPKIEYLELCKNIKGFLEKNRNIKRYAIRSSQLYEDGKENSFSGLFYTKLNVGNTIDIANAILKCWTESFNTGVIEYSKKNPKFKAIPCSVIVQQFIISNKSGVIFNLGKDIVLDANYGLAKSIVDGDTGCDEWTISRHDKHIVNYTNNKEKMNIPILTRVNPNIGTIMSYQNYKDLDVINFDNKNTVIEVGLPENLKKEKSMNDREIKDLLDVCEKVSKYLNIEHYDIEWTIDLSGKIYILQCRPITTKFEVSGNFEENNKKYGIGLVNGEVTAKVSKIVTRNDAMNFKKGNILVAKRLSGDILLAANKASGCIIESKSPLSHSAIIARELGIPAIGNVNINDIENNKFYYINGKTGEYCYIIKGIQDKNKKEKIKVSNKENLDPEIKQNILNDIYTFKQNII